MRWLNDVSMDLRKMILSGGRDRARNREDWGRVVEEASAHSGLLRHLEGRKEINLVRKIWVYLGMLPKVILWIFKFVTKLQFLAFLTKPALHKQR